MTNADMLALSSAGFGSWLAGVHFDPMMGGRRVIVGAIHHFATKIGRSAFLSLAPRKAPWRRSAPRLRSLASLHDSKAEIRPSGTKLRGDIASARRLRLYGKPAASLYWNDAEGGGGGSAVQQRLRGDRISTVPISRLGLAVSAGIVAGVRPKGAALNHTFVRGVSQTTSARQGGDKRLGGLPFSIAPHRVGSRQQSSLQPYSSAIVSANELKRSRKNAQLKAEELAVTRPSVRQSETVSSPMAETRLKGVDSGRSIDDMLERYFLAQARLPPSGMGGFDPRLSPTWAGLQLPG